MEEEKKKTTFCVRIFDISPCVFTQIMSGRACWMHNLIPHPTSTHSAYFWRTLLPQKQEIHEKMWWWCHHHIFSGISCFGGSEVCQKYAVWVLVGSGIKFRTQQVLPLEIWVTTQGDMSKIQTKKVVLFYDKYVNSTIMVDSFYWNSIGYWIPTHKNLLLARFLIRSILDPKFPLMHAQMHHGGFTCWPISYHVSSYCRF